MTKEVWNRPPLQQLKELQQKAGEKRMEAWNKLSTMEKIAALDERLGPNVGAKKQRARLKSQLEAEHAAKEAEKIAKKQKKEKASTETEKPKRKAKERRKASN